MEKNFCLDKKCSWCCDPVKVKRFFPVDKIPLDQEGKPLWIQRNELLIEEKNPDGPKWESFDCKNLDLEKGGCKDYENRPKICRQTSCLKSDEKISPEEQQKRMTNTKFIKITI